MAFEGAPQGFFVTGVSVQLAKVAQNVGFLPKEKNTQHVVSGIIFFLMKLQFQSMRRRSSSRES